MTPDFNSNIYVSPLGILFGSINAAYEFRLSDKISLGPMAAFTTRSSGGQSATGFGLGANMTVYLNETFKDSWFVAPYLLFAYASNSGSSATGISIGTDVGYWWYWANGINLSFGLGAQYISLDYTSLGLTSISGVLPSLKFTLGFAL